MKILHKLFILSSLMNMQVNNHYVRHNQSCGGMNGTDTKWSLDLNDNNTFTFKITERKNQYLSKPKTTLINGTWKANADTLKLFQWVRKDDMLIFYKEDNRLIFQNNKSTLDSSQLLYLDYLENPGG
jgi:hypothetical protein